MDGIAPCLWRRKGGRYFVQDDLSEERACGRTTVPYSLLAGVYPVAHATLWSRFWYDAEHGKARGSGRVAKVNAHALPGESLGGACHGQMSHNARCMGSGILVVTNKKVATYRVSLRGAENFHTVEPRIIPRLLNHRNACERIAGHDLWAVGHNAEYGHCGPFVEPCWAERYPFGVLDRRHL